MVQAKPTVKLTFADYCKTPDDERWELIDGELIMAPSPTGRHQLVVGKLYRLLADFVERSGLGMVFLAPFDVVLSELNVVQPDVMFISDAKAHILTDANVQGAPDLVVEVLSPSTASRDWRTKLDLYAEYGVQEYWVVDPDGKRVWVMARVDGVLGEVGNYGKEDTLISPTLPGFIAELSQVFQQGNVRA